MSPPLTGASGGLPRVCLPPRAEVVVGLATFNNERTIGHVLRAVGLGLRKYFPQARAVVVASDAGSTDGTFRAAREAWAGEGELLLLSHPLCPAHRLVFPWHGVPGKASALRTVFQVAEGVGARACAVLDARLRSINPDWMDLLIRPILHVGYDYAAPRYLRHKHDGALTNLLFYPLVRALYGHRIRQPIGGDFCVSSRLAARYLKESAWEAHLAGLSPDLWITAAALCGGYRVCQSFLGPRVRDATGPGAGLAEMLSQAAGALFRLMEVHASRWIAVHGSQQTVEFGARRGVELEPVPMGVDRMVGRFRRGLRDLRGIWAGFLRPAAMRELAELAAAEPEQFHVPDVVWARVVYDFAAAWHRRRLERGGLLRSLAPLYWARLASFVVETRESFGEEVEERIERLCVVFEEWKPYLIGQWRAAPALLLREKAALARAPQPSRA